MARKPKFIPGTPGDHIWETLNHSKTLLGSSAVLAALGLAANLDSGLKVPAWVFWLLAVAFLCVAQYRTYRDLRKKYDPLKEAEGARTERSRHLREDREITGETFGINELVTPKERPLVEHRVFTDCIIEGPGLVSPQMGIDFTNCTWTSPADTWIQELQTPGVRVGVIALVDCQFLRCTFENLSFLVDKAMADEFRKTRVL
jgi:hypothetical protein